MRKNVKFITLMLSLILCLVTVSFGQRTTGDIEGTVKDPQGAVVPNVSITVVSSQSTATSPSGFIGPGPSYAGGRSEEVHP